MSSNPQVKEQEMSLPERIVEILDGDIDLLLNESEELGKQLAGDDLAKNQIRNIYSTVKRIAATRKFGIEEQSELKLLIPKIRYAIARATGSPKGMKRLGDTLILCIEKVGDNASRFQRFADFFESVVAFHYHAHEERKQEKQRKR